MHPHVASYPSLSAVVSAHSDWKSAPPVPEPKLSLLKAEGTPLESLVHHREFVAAGTPLEIAPRAFQTQRVEYMALVDNDRVVGLCARGQIGFIMSSRFGFALYSQSPVESVRVSHPLIVPCDMPVRELLNRAMARQNEEFQEEVVLVDRESRLLGLIPVGALAQLQSLLVEQQLEELRQQNLELFRTNHALRQSQGLYLGLFKSQILGVAFLDVQGGLHEHNQRLAALLGLDPDSAARIPFVSCVVAEERAEFLALLQKCIRGDSPPLTREFNLLVPQRGPRLFRCSFDWIRETGQICTCLDDITDQRALERNLLRQEKQTLLDTLVGGIAHELNNKLTPVRGFAELLSDCPASTAQSYLGFIKKGAAEAAEIVRQLLQLSKPASPVMATVDLRPIVEEAVAILRYQLRESRCEIRTLLPSSPTWVLAEAAQVKQVVINLMLNAMHALTGRPHPLLVLELKAGDPLATLTVTDNGCGISGENLRRIFDPFFTTKGPEHGTGLGLSICYSVVRQHGGEIRVESQFGKGTSFTVTLPLEKRSPLLSASEAPQLATSAAAGDSLHTTRVLIVEDEEVVCLLLQEVLRTQFRCQVDMAANGAEALLALERGIYNLILSDIRMPVMTGPELYVRIRETHSKLAPNFVFITGHPGEFRMEDEIAQWNVPVIAKPFTMAEITQVCSPYLRTAPAKSPPL